MRFYTYILNIPLLALEGCRTSKTLEATGHGGLASTLLARITQNYLQARINTLHIFQPIWFLFFNNINIFFILNYRNPTITMHKHLQVIDYI